MKKLVKQGAKLAHILIDILAKEIAGTKLSKEKNNKYGKRKTILTVAAALATVLISIFTKKK